MHTSTPTALPAPAFTLGSALHWLAHECSGPRCSADIDGLDASVWFIRRGERFGALPMGTLILVDPAEVGIAMTRLRRAIDQVGSCARSDGIDVRARNVELEPNQLADNTW